MEKTLTKRDKELDDLEKIYKDKIKELQGKGEANNKIRDKLYSMYKSDKKLSTDNGEIALKKVIFDNFLDIQDSEPKISGSDYSYQPYSETNAADFLINTTWKKEFRDNKNDEINDRCSVPVFRLTPHQYLLSNFISPDTKYMSLLLFHGTGTGKTCTAISIAENFKDSVDEFGPIIVICGKSLKDNFYTNLFDIDKIGEEDQDSQCIGSVYYDLLNDTEKKKTKHLQHKAIKRKINKFYDISTYFTFAKDLSKEKFQQGEQSKKAKPDEYSLSKEIHDKKMEYIKQDNPHEYRAMIEKEYSNKVIIVDEVQSLRDEDHSEFDFKLITDILMDIAKYSRNTRMILLSATPMYNEPGEIEWLINVMRVNDNKSQIEPNKVFTENGDLTEEGGDILAKYSRGYISYVTNDDPINFPLRLYPDVYNDKLSRYNVLSANHRDFFNGKHLISKNNFNKLKLFYPNPWTVKDGIQKDILREYHEDKMGKKTKTLDLSEANKLTQMSLIVYPNSATGKIPRELMTSRGDTYKYNDTSKPFLKMDQLQKYSIKFYETIKKIAEFIGDKDYPSFGGATSPTDGIIFVYCSEVESGIIPFCLALEQYGFTRYGGDSQLLDKSDLKWSPISWDGRRERKKGQIMDKAKYIVITGDTPIDARDQLISAVKNKSNIKGRNIRVIIGSRVMSEGISLKWVRQIHILDAWYHLNRIEQIIGRGLRFCSHKGYPRDERNVMVYLHSIHPMQNKSFMLDSHDMYLYRKAWGKAVQMGRVETILKENSIDCELHKDTNNIDISNLSEENQKHIPERIKFTQKKKGIRYRKKRYTKSKKYGKNCSYTNTCNYTCHKRPKKRADMTENTDTYGIIHENKKITQCIDLIKTYYRTHVATNFKTLLKYCSQTGVPEDYVQILKFALHIMVSEKIEIIHNGKTGYISRKNIYITFTQYNREYDPLYYRRSNLKRRTNRKPARLLYTKVYERDFIIDKGSIIDKIKVNRLVGLYERLNMTSQEEDRFVLEYNLDRLTYDELKNLLPKIYLSQNENEQDKQIYNYFKNSFYNDGKTDYFILFNNNMKSEIFKIDMDLLKVRDELDARLRKILQDIVTDEKTLGSLKKDKDKDKKKHALSNKRDNLENLKTQIKKNNNKMKVDKSSIEFKKTIRAFKSNTNAKHINPDGKGYGFIKDGRFVTSSVTEKIGKGAECFTKGGKFAIMSIKKLIDTEKIPKKILGDSLHKLINSDMKTIQKSVPKYKQLLCLLQEYLLRYLTIKGRKYWYSRHDYGMYSLSLN